uniref:peptidylprolyl isomerase n=1 Tax=Vaucheria litorea TaxID=109269 RepID=H6WB92_VAULI|nr:trigger factor [Vaucheria litorea]
MVEKIEFSAITTPDTNSSVRIIVDIPGTATQKAYQDTLRDLSKKQSIPGFNSSSNKRIPEQVLVGYFGEGVIKGSTLELLADTAIKDAIQSADIKAIGQAKLIEEAEKILLRLVPGEPLQLEVKVDVWPNIKFTGDYTGFTIAVQSEPLDQSQYDATLQRLRERAVVSVSAPENHAANKGDAIIVDMSPFEVLEDGSRGDPLPQLAGGEDLEIVLEAEKFMPGLIDGLLGIKVGEMREIPVQFPDKLGGEANVLAGKKAVFDVTCNEVLLRTLPEVNDDFANSIRPGLTLAELDKEILSALNSEGDKKKFEARDKALEAALLERIEAEIPETLVIERARQKFAIMMADMKSQGQQDDAELRKMITPENFNKYKEVVRESTTKQLKVSLALSMIAEKEGIELDQGEIEDQLELIRAEVKGEEFDEAVAKERIEATLQKNKASFSCLLLTL